ncbi:hypothetical protein [Sphingomonas sp.]|uniref:hypothetical protein n=1 Tax=Sphingomonas sp. TaxID=28214 RepID=UPI003D6D49FA
MRFMHLSLGALAAILAAAPAVAEKSDRANARPAKEKKVCRPVVGTGTILARPYCLTRAEWAEMDERNRRDHELVEQRKFNNMKKPTPFEAY